MRFVRLFCSLLLICGGVALFAQVGGTTTRVGSVIAADIPVPPTVPCEGCGPSGQRGDGTQVWAYPEHRCAANTGESVFNLVVGVGDLVAPYSLPVTFYYRTSPTDLLGQPIEDGVLYAGEQLTTGSLFLVQPGETVWLEVFAIGGNGVPVGFYAESNGQSAQKQFMLTCPCDVPPTTVPATTVPTDTTVPVTTPSTSPTPTTVPSTVPPSGPTTPPVTTAPTSSSPEATTTTLTGTLPATGTTSSRLGVLAMVLCAAGAVLLLTARRIPAES